MKVKNYLNKIKANRYTYNNLDKNHIKDFQKLYNYLKTQQEKEVSKWFEFYVSVNNWLNNEYILDYVIKYKAMEILSTEIKN